MFVGEIQCVYIQLRRYLKMMAFANAKSGYCTSFAAACTSAPKVENMDTAILAVSILLSCEICALCT